MRALALALVLVVACTKPNPNRCCTDEADCAAKGISAGSQCADGLVCRGNQCIAEPCDTALECDGAAPYCVDGLCGEACNDDSQCPGFGQAAVAYCIAGVCVGCRTSADCSDPALAVCDGGSCRGCTAHGECASKVCDLDTGICQAESTVAYASPSGSTSSACTKSDPCALPRALTVLDATRNVLKLEDGTYSDSASISTDQLVRIYGPAKVHTFGISGSGTLIARDLAADGFGCSAPSALVPLATLDIKRATIVSISDLTGLGSGAYCKLTLRNVVMKNPFLVSTLYMSHSPMLTIDQSWIDGGSPPLSLSQGSSAAITNSVISSATTNVGTPTAIAYDSSTAPSTVSFSTFYNAPWSCVSTGNLVWASTNNIFLNEKPNPPADTVTGTKCSHDYDLIKPQSTAPNGANNILNQDPRFVNGANGDFHLVMGSPAINAADPSATVSVDYDGTARPQGAARDIGAFEYKP